MPGRTVDLGVAEAREVSELDHLRLIARQLPERPAQLLRRLPPQRLLVGELLRGARLKDRIVVEGQFRRPPALLRRTSIARLRTMLSIHDLTLPRAWSKRVPLRQIEMKASWVTSSATARSPTIRYASE